MTLRQIRKITFLPTTIQYIWRGNLNVNNVVRNLVRSGLNKHQKSVHDGITIRYQFDLCDPQTSSQTSQYRHSVHMGTKHLCQECAQQFTGKKSLASHHMSVHMNIKYPCKLNDYQAAEKKNLTRHHQSVHLGRKYLCLECGRNFK